MGFGPGAREQPDGDQPEEKGTSQERSPHGREDTLFPPPVHEGRYFCGCQALLLLTHRALVGSVLSYQSVW